MKSLYQLKIERHYPDQVVTAFMPFEKLDAALSQEASFIEVAEERGMAVRTTVITDCQERSPRSTNAYLAMCESNKIPGPHPWVGHTVHQPI